MNSIIESMTGMDKMNDQVIATDFLIATKSGIKNYAVALSEAASPEVRNTLKRQLDDAISMHEKVTDYMIDKGYYKAYNPEEQFRADVQAADTALNLGK
ncbi:spore coat protein [Clostridium oryzae]|uniref:Spore coat protein F n=1 Tax=Clostridium oryzae TaxID=1450648 RepID=A0A1V4IK32_9CLOT|nr:spore coat protein [Clostridium oryzae]OPJ60388.1 spore coat protein F precursor [Clostridium oryzae]